MAGDTAFIKLGEHHHNKEKKEEKPKGKERGHSMFQCICEG